VKADT